MHLFDINLTVHLIKLNYLHWSISTLSMVRLGDHYQIYSDSQDSDHGQMMNMFFLLIEEWVITMKNKKKILFGNLTKNRLVLSRSKAPLLPMSMNADQPQTPPKNLSVVNGTLPRPVSPSQSFKGNESVVPNRQLTSSGSKQGQLSCFNRSSRRCSSLKPRLLSENKEAQRQHSLPKLSKTAKQRKGSIVVRSLALSKKLSLYGENKTEENDGEARRDSFESNHSNDSVESVERRNFNERRQMKRLSTVIQSIQGDVLSAKQQFLSITPALLEQLLTLIHGKDWEELQKALINLKKRQAKINSYIPGISISKQNQLTLSHLRQPAQKKLDLYSQVIDLKVSGKVLLHTDSIELESESILGSSSSLLEEVNERVDLTSINYEQVRGLIIEQGRYQQQLMTYGQQLASSRLGAKVYVTKVDMNAIDKKVDKMEAILRKRVTYQEESIETKLEMVRQFSSLIKSEYESAYLQLVEVVQKKTESLKKLTEMMKHSGEKCYARMEVSAKMNKCMTAELQAMNEMLLDIKIQVCMMLSPCNAATFRKWCEAFETRLERVKEGVKLSRMEA